MAVTVSVRVMVIVWVSVIVKNSVTVLVRVVVPLVDVVVTSEEFVT